jgi:hypothetical protein
MSETIRLQIEIERHVMDELEDLCKLGGLKTKRDLLNNAMTLLKWAAREKSKGHSICSASPDGRIQKELELPFLESVAVTVHRAAMAAAAKVNGRKAKKEEQNGNHHLSTIIGSDSLRLTGST